MNRRIISIIGVLGACVAGLILLTSCGADESAVATVGNKLEPVDERARSGTYAIYRIDGESGMPESMEEAVPVGTFTIELGDVTFAFHHEEHILAGNVNYLTATHPEGHENAGDLFWIMQLKVLRVDNIQRNSIMSADVLANREAGREPDTSKEHKTYRQYVNDLMWRFELVDDGYVHIANDFGPALYYFKRDDEREPLPSDTGMRGAPSPNIAGVGGP